MRLLLLFTCVCTISSVKAGIREVWYHNVTLQTDSIDRSLEENEAKYTFEFYGLDGTKNNMVYSIDGQEGKGKLHNHSIQIITAPGKHIFQFFYSENYFEVYSDSLEIKDQHHSVYRVLMERSDTRIEVHKPVIYLYPREETEVRVTLDIKGEPTFLYPNYDDGWNFKATPSGDLVFGDRTYNYLFWEASQNRVFSAEELTSGFTVRGEEVVGFLEDKLTEAGLNSQEQADFITFWGPRLSSNERNFIHFEFNENCNKYAHLTISPKPDNVYRIFMIFSPIDEDFHVTEQYIERFDRTGFSVLEWGGAESDLRTSFITQTNE